MSSNEQRMPLEPALALAQDWARRLLPFCDDLKIAGSIRRKKETVGDLEIVALPMMRHSLAITDSLGPNFRSLLTDDEARILRNIPKGRLPGWIKDKAMEIAARSGRHVQYKGGWPGKATNIALPEGICLDLYSPAPLAFPLIYFIRTGSAEFVHAMASHSARMGWIWEEGQVYRRGSNNKPSGAAVPIPTEQAVFDQFDVQFVPPERRRTTQDLINAIKDPKLADKARKALDV